MMRSVLDATKGGFRGSASPVDDDTASMGSVDADEELLLQENAGNDEDDEDKVRMDMGRGEFFS